MIASMLVVGFHDLKRDLQQLRDITLCGMYRLIYIAVKLPVY